MGLLHSILVKWLRTHGCLWNYGSLFEELSVSVYIVKGRYLWHIKTSTGCGRPINRNSKIVKWAIRTHQYVDMQEYRKLRG